ncbi:1089_t:CDS:2 [Paraglomus occultum]|uniref:1089_t:CDS:1 n=1 Tax=Paraglomus occultum TaxID=144539 RepID=A0A9N9FKT7_9GLOM|nr:1089_t:CDS:2 [Paraglomus occultum]
MFILSTFRDTLTIIPKDFRKSKLEALSDEINKKYANKRPTIQHDSNQLKKVVHDVGLCVCLHDIIDTSEEFVHYGDGSSYVKVKFRMVVFRPFIGELLVGKIKTCTPEGVRVSIDFFDDIHIPSMLLKHQSVFDQSEQAWVWHYEPGLLLWMEVDDLVRFRVVGEAFTDITPMSAPRSRGGLLDTNLAGNSAQIPPYQLRCSIQEDGLGPLAWWQDQ